MTTTQAITRLTLNIAIALEDAPAPGSLLRVDANGKQFWLVVQEVKASVSEDSPSAEQVEVTGEGLYWLQAPPVDLPVSSPSCEKLTFELAVRRDGGYPQRLSGLAFAPQHPQFWDALPTDERLYAGADAITRSPYRDLWQAVVTPRFPLAGEEAKHLLFFPVAMPPLGDLWLSADRPSSDALERDGLDQFDAMLFLDDALTGSSVTTLIDQADFIRYQSVQVGKVGRELCGIYAGLGLEEATLIVVPDAVHRGWRTIDTAAPPPPEPQLPFERPQWWTFLDCKFPLVFERVSAPRLDNFLACDLRVVDAPTLTVTTNTLASPITTDTIITDRGDYLLSWTPVNEVGIRYVLEESPRPNFTDATVIYIGVETAFTVSARGFGDYYYHVRAEVAGETSDWSNGVVVRVAPLRRWVAYAEEKYADVQPGTLLAVQRALLRLCAARGDLFAVMALPAHYREDDAIRHVALLRSPLPLALEIAPNEGSFVPPLGYGEARVFSYGALYHPWLTERVQEQPLILQSSPPDGAACGAIAQRALNRGAWIAPANEVLRDLVALTPPIARERWLDLQLAQVNIVRQEPRGFVIMSADTLSNDPDLRPINVRRLLMLLRRLALRQGFRYVFEPNDESFRRLVQRGFEALLEQMFVRGAFAGTTPATSFQVVTSNTLNTRQSVEEGRFIVELRVAPSLPMTFLTVRLVQTHERTFVSE